MPNFDGTGPRGKGPGSGRGREKCNVGGKDGKEQVSINKIAGSSDKTKLDKIANNSNHQINNNKKINNNDCK